MFTCSLNRGKKVLKRLPWFMALQRHIDYLSIKTDIQIICVLKLTEDGQLGKKVSKKAPRAGGTLSNPVLEEDRTTGTL